MFEIDYTSIHMDVGTANMGFKALSDSWWWIYRAISYSSQGTHYYYVNLWKPELQLVFAGVCLFGSFRSSPLPKAFTPRTHDGLLQSIGVMAIENEWGMSEVFCHERVPSFPWCFSHVLLVDYHVCHLITPNYNSMHHESLWVHGPGTCQCVYGRVLVTFDDFHRPVVWVSLGHIPPSGVPWRSL